MERRELTRQLQELTILLGKTSSLQQDFEQLGNIPEVSSVPVIATLQQQLSMQQAEFAQLKLSYLPKHPRYIAAAKKIEISTQQLKTEIDKLTHNYRVRQADLRRMLDQIEGKVTNATANLESLVNVGQDHKKLEAEIQANLHLLNTLSEKMKATELMKDINKTSSIIVVDPATVPISPVGPRRTLLSIAALLIGFIGAVFLVLCLHFFAEIGRAHV